MGLYALEFKRVGTRRGLKNVLHNIDFKIKSGESVALLGPNGSGKSTLIKLITRELYPTAGEIKVFGQKDWDVFDLRSQFGVVSNDLQTTFTRDITAMEAVLSGFFGGVGLWRNNRVTPDMTRQAGQFLKKLDLSHLKNRLMEKLSSGESRRVLIARALIHSPQTLVFDEPTNSLDLKAQNEFRATLRKLAKSGMGIVMATHHLPDIIPEIQRVIVLKGGKIQADGPKEKILSPQKLKHLFGVPVSVMKKDGLYHVS